jgi:hypothetical protein
MKLAESLDVYESDSYCLLGCDAMLFGRHTFWRSLSIFCPVVPFIKLCDVTPADSSPHSDCNDTLRSLCNVTDTFFMLVAHLSFSSCRL